MRVPDCGLKNEINSNEEGSYAKMFTLKYRGLKKNITASKTIARALAFCNILLGHEKHIYKNDIIAGSIKGICFQKYDAALHEEALNYISMVGERDFPTNFDHAAPNYAKLLDVGIKGLLEEIKTSAHTIGKTDPQDVKRLELLKSVEIAIKAFSKYMKQYAYKAKKMSMLEQSEAEKEKLLEMSKVCNKISYDPPSTFLEALQLVWLAHTAFVIEGRYAMALGRLDQYLYPYYIRDVANGRISRASAAQLLENTFMKIGELKVFCNRDDVVNICIGGLKPDGSDGTNELSYLILEAVKNCNIPGPNLSARFHGKTYMEFYLKCLDVIKTGIGYPALFNDEVIIPTLIEKGYPVEDARNYCLVGCVEVFIQGKQPPWSDGRFNTAKYIELALNNGCSMATGKRIGVTTGNHMKFDTFEQFLNAIKKQIEYGAKLYAGAFLSQNKRLNAKEYTSPFLSALCDDCIKRGKDINDGGTAYPSNHGVACMGIGTVSDSLAAVNELVYNKRIITIDILVKALKADFRGYEHIQLMLKNSAPKYGNDDEAVDKFAVWYVEFMNNIFCKYRTPDGGYFLTLMAANIQNIYAGKETFATPDGRNAYMPLSDAASPTYGMDKKGPTAVVNSVTKPNYRLVAGGSVLNQKFHPDVFKNKSVVIKLAALLKTYFEKGGQEIQINTVSKNMLIDARNNPHLYKDLVVRVSGFSAYYIDLADEVKMDIITRTEQTI